MTKRRRSRVPAKAGINITPLIDILLVLLVIFMTITPRTPVGFTTHIPQPPPPGPHRQADDEAIVIRVRNDGTVQINRKVTALSSLFHELLTFTGHAATRLRLSTLMSNFYLAGYRK
jgi:biopolymer transport protein TolR